MKMYDTNGNELISQGKAVAQNGWFPVTDSWAYASASTITVPSGAGNLYAIGDKIKFTQSGSPKYFYIVGVTDTVLTVTGGSDYTVADATISDIYYSHSQSPIGFPQWFNWTTTYGGFSSAPSGGTYMFSIVGRTCHLIIYQLTHGTSNATSFTLTAPVIAAGLNAQGHCRSFDNNSVNTGYSWCLISSGSTTITVYRDTSGTAWTNSGNKSVRELNLTYQI